jgi:hypothetical protein
MESFDELVNLLSSSPSLDDLNDSLSEYLSHKKMQESVNLKLTNQIINFLNNLIPIISDDFEKNLKKVKTALDRLQIANKNISNEEIGTLFIQKIKEFINNKFGNHFVNLDWQVSVLDRKNDTTNLNKSEKVEITTKINNFNANEQKYESHVIKMDFNEFTEIMSNFKKIDEQLHLFKN